MQNKRNQALKRYDVMIILLYLKEMKSGIWKIEIKASVILGNNRQYKCR